MLWHGATHDIAPSTNADNITPSASTPCSPVLERAAQAVRQALTTTEDATPSSTPLTSPTIEASRDQQGAGAPARRVLLPRSCRKPALPSRSAVPLLDPLPPRNPWQRSHFQLAAYSAHAPVLRQVPSVECLGTRSTSVGLRYRIMRKSVDAKVICDFSPRPKSMEGVKQSKERESDDVHVSKHAGAVDSHCLGAAAPDSRNEGEDHDSAPPESPSRGAVAPITHYTCSVCNADTAKDDMTARAHCKSCSKLCTQLRSRHGKLKYVHAAFQQLGTTADHAAVLELAAKIVQEAEGGVAGPGGSGVNVKAINQATTALHIRQPSHVQPPCKIEAAEPAYGLSLAMPVQVTTISLQPSGSKRKSGRPTQRAHKSSRGNIAEGAKIKSELCTRATVQNANGALMREQPSVPLLELLCSVCGSKFKTEKKVVPTLCTNCVVCYRRARELSYTILELKNAVTGGYVVPIEQPSATDIRTAVSRMLLGQPKAKAGADRSSRAARRLGATAAAQSAARDSTAAQSKQAGLGQAVEDAPAKAHVAETRRHHSAPAHDIPGDAKDCQEHHSVRPSAPAVVTAFHSGQAFLASKPDIAPASPSRSHGAEVLDEPGQHDTAAGSGTDATATGYEEREQDAAVPSSTIPGKVPEVWKRQISQMIQDVVHQQPVDARAFLQCVSEHADTFAKAVFESEYAQSSVLWKHSGGCDTPETATADNANGNGCVTESQAPRRLRVDALSTGLAQAGVPQKTAAAGRPKRKSRSLSQELPDSQEESCHAKRARAQAVDHGSAGIMQAAMKALEVEGIQIDANVDRILGVSIPAIHAYLSSGDRGGDGQTL